MLWYFVVSLVLKKFMEYIIKDLMVNELFGLLILNVKEVK